jgi:AcrR family transcriptional regulator
MAALAESVSVRGYAGLTVEDVIARAGVSRRTFYDQFANKEDAFLAAYDEVTAQLLENIDVALRSAEDFADAVERCLEAFLYYLAVEPAFAHMCMVDVLAAGQSAIDRRNAVMQRFLELFELGERTLENPPPPLTSELVVGAIHAVAYARIAEDRTAELPALLPDLLYACLLPYVGHRSAERARRNAQRRLEAGEAR